MEAAPTDSHALAMKDQPVKGLSQQAGHGEVKDLGWNEPKELIASPLVGGLQNEDLWILIRRFNKVRLADMFRKPRAYHSSQQMYHVKEMTATAPGNLDMNVADEDEFSPDKLRSTVERLYMTVVRIFRAMVSLIANAWPDHRCVCLCQTPGSLEIMARISANDKLLCC